GGMTGGRRELDVRTRWRTEVVDITDQVRDAVRESAIVRGFVHCFVPHTTAAITLNERNDPKVVADFAAHLERLVPWGGAWTHPGNAAAHVKASLVGHALVLAVEDGELQLGQWQGLFLCEFHGPRARTVRLSIQAYAE
ncbi:MAG TPA: secondary thiamine-phosphate synthase enzyme YjbQ, partial [Candidatus Methanoperedens sp.]|nr:secondary thiamine-phosphate synthase enzyme YjbQ [Candidatus Methanoperedens sp.]